MIGNRVYLRRFNKNDVLATYDYLSNESVVKYEPYEAMTLDEVKEVVNDRITDTAFYAVCLKSTDDLIGNLYFDSLGNDTYMLGYVFNEKFQKRGYATESVTLLLKDAFSNRQAKRIEAKCNPLNTSSWKLLERLGFKRDNHLVRNIAFKKDEFDQPIWQDTYEYSMSKEMYNRKG